MANIDPIDAKHIRRGHPGDLSASTMNGQAGLLARHNGLALGGAVGGRQSIGGLSMAPAYGNPMRLVRLKTGLPVGTYNIYEGYLVEVDEGENPPTYRDGDQIWLAFGGGIPADAPAFPVFAEGDDFFRFNAWYAGTQKDNAGDFRDLYLFNPTCFFAFLKFIDHAPGMSPPGYYLAQYLHDDGVTTREVYVTFAGGNNPDLGTF